MVAQKSPAQERSRRKAAPEDDIWPSGFLVPGTRWKVGSWIGSGGMGNVYAVVKEPAGIAGALKVLRTALAAEVDLAARFLSEAQLLASVRHPNLVQVIDFDTLPDGRPFMVMELLEGQTLRGCLQSAYVRGFNVTAKNTCHIITQLCEGLQTLHSRHPAVVHRDVKPENVFLHRAPHGAGAGAVKVLDLGLAGLVAEAADPALGTRRYMSPEQVRGGQTTERSDQYAAALVLFEMLTGRFPWDIDVRDEKAVLHAHLALSAYPPSRFCPWVSPRVDEAILRALAKEPGERWPSISSFADGVRELNDVDDGSAYANPTVNTTAPTVDTLAASGTLKDRRVYDTDVRMDPPPVEGSSLEVAELFYADRDPGCSQRVKSADLPVTDGCAATTYASRSRPSSPTTTLRAASSNEPASVAVRSMGTNVRRAREPANQPLDAEVRDTARGRTPARSGSVEKGTSPARGGVRWRLLALAVPIAAGFVLSVETRMRTGEGPNEASREAPLEVKLPDFLVLAPTVLAARMPRPADSQVPQDTLSATPSAPVEADARASVLAKKKADGKRVAARPTSPKTIASAAPIGSDRSNAFFETM